MERKAAGLLLLVSFCEMTVGEKIITKSQILEDLVRACFEHVEMDQASVGIAIISGAIPSSRQTKLAPPVIICILDFASAVIEVVEAKNDWYEIEDRLGTNAGDCRRGNRPGSVREAVEAWPPRR